MYKDTIYREDAIKTINARSNWYQVTCNGKQIAVMLMAKDVNEILEKLPSADRPNEKDCKFCRCHEKEDVLYELVNMESGFVFDKIRNIKYCPLCGAMLEGADDE